MVTARQPPTVPAEHRTVSRVIAILEMAVHSEPHGVSLGDLASPLGAAKSSVHGLAKGLVAVGYLRERQGRYFTGPAIYGLLAGAPNVLLAAHHHVLEGLMKEWHETAFLATLVGRSVVYVDRVETSRGIRALPELDTRFPLYPRSSGKCFLAWMTERHAETALRAQNFNTNAIATIKQELARVREAGVATNIGGLESDHLGVASPIHNGDSPVTLAVAMAGPAARMQPHLDEIAASVRTAASELSTRSAGT